MVFFPNEVLNNILNYCDDRIEKKQKFYQKGVNASIIILHSIKVLAELEIKIINLDEGYIDNIPIHSLGFHTYNDYYISNANDTLKKMIVKNYLSFNSL